MGGQSWVHLRNEIQKGPNSLVVGSTEKRCKCSTFQAGHHSKEITPATGQVMGFHITVTFKSCKDHALGKVKRTRKRFYKQDW